ncbi:hypothetical protein N867_05625, partial [Actinotalea fermentans ATCC 43279 = JCM 9966 = DSM 3133]
MPARPIAVGIVLAAVTAGAVVAPAQAAATITVTTTADAAIGPDCDDGLATTSLREALCQAADASGGAVVALPAGTYALVLGALVIDPGHPSILSLVGAGAATTTIDARGVSRVLDVDASLTGGVDLTVQGVTLRGGVGTPGTGGGGAIIAGSVDPAAPDSLTLLDCALTGNRNASGVGTPTDVGGAVSMTGGTLSVARCTFSQNTSYGAGGSAIGYTGVGGTDTVDVTGSVFVDNTVDGTTAGIDVGGALDVAWGSPATTVTGSTFLRNLLTTGTRAARGSAVRVAAGSATLTGVDVAGNRAVGGIGSTAAVHLNAGVVSDSRIVGNVTTVGDMDTRAGVAGASSAVRTWWGCTDLGPACDSAGGATTAPHAVPSLTLAPATASVGDAVTATADLRLSDGAAATAALRGAMAGAAISWLPASLGFTSTLPFHAAGPATATFTAAGAATVTVSIDGVAVSADLAVAIPPAVTDDPDDTEVVEGSDATFTAAASGAPAPTVAWESRADASSSWEPVPGATSATLTLPDLPRADDGTQVRAVFTNSSGTATSAAATVRVAWGPEDLTDPADVSGLVGDAVTFSVSASGRPVPTVAWETSTDGVSWTVVAGETDWSYTRTLGAGDDGLRVRAVATGATGDVESASARVTLLSAPAITTPPADTAVDPGQDGVFTVAGTGVPTPSITWQFRVNGGGWLTASATTGTFTFEDVTVDVDGVEVRALLTNAHGTATSDVATLRVFHGPTITTQPSSVTGSTGDAVSFTVAAEGYPVPGVAWQTSTDGLTWDPVPDVTSATYTRTLSTSDDGLRVRALVTGRSGQVPSGTAVVTVRDVPTVTNPAAADVAVGGDAGFTVTVGGYPAATVTWERRASAADPWTEAGTGTSLLLADVTRADDGTQVRAIATNAAGTATSQVATLTVRWAPSFLLAPVDASGLAGDAVTFRALAEANPAPTIAWQTSTDGTTWTPVPGETAWTYTRTLAAADDGLWVRAVATNSEGSAESGAARITIDTSPTFPVGPGNAVADLGTSATFSVTVAGRPAPDVAWEVDADATGDWVAVPGVSGTSLVVPATEAAHGSRYRAVATSTRGAATSAPATLTVLVPPTVTDPHDVATAPGRAVTFSVDVSGRPLPDVVWQSSSDGGVTWEAVGGGLALTLTATLADDGRLFRAVASAELVSGVTDAVSAPAELVVAEAPQVLDGPGPLTTLTAGAPRTLTWTVLGAGTTAQWEVSRDGGVTWSPLPAGWAAGAPVAGAPAVGASVANAPLPSALGSGLAAQAAGPAVRTTHSVTLTPAAADDGAHVRLTVTTAGGSVTVSTALDVVVPPAASGGGTGGGTGTRPALSDTGADPLPLVALSALLAAAGVVVLAGAA